VASWAVNHAIRGEHRTEVTEVTERAGTVGTYASPYADTPYTDPPTRFSPEATEGS
jgi:hypothetical protein